jgi:transposase-like protein
MSVRREGVTRATIAKELGVLTMALRHAKKHREHGHSLFQRDPKELMPLGVENAYTPCDRVLTTEEFAALRQHIAPSRHLHLDLQLEGRKPDEALLAPDQPTACAAHCGRR